VPPTPQRMTSRRKRVRPSEDHDGDEPTIRLPTPPRSVYEARGTRRGKNDTRRVQRRRSRSGLWAEQQPTNDDNAARNGAAEDR